ncbi:MAG: molybdenum cofactor biosynthesis protein MoaE [Roseiflexaceae bacterium]|nr:molybdenum cofactor biosynthesis protein MoaE [Roseiflexaceae bacterium]
MVVTVRYFAAHREVTGQATEQFELAEHATVGALWAAIAGRYPRLAGYGGRMLYAINQQWSELGSELREGDEVAFIPPVSGGAPELFLVSEAALDPLPLQSLVASPDMGAIVSFCGVARNNFGGRATAWLEYQAYQEMAVTVLREIAGDARGRWNTGQIAIHHRVGRLAIGEAAVIIVVAAPHRHEAFAAAEWIMDRIKQIAPIWKKEIWADGASEWVGEDRAKG